MAVKQPFCMPPCMGPNARAMCTLDVGHVIMLHAPSRVHVHSVFAAQLPACSAVLQLPNN
jgi:hypothetical protein